MKKNIKIEFDNEKYINNFYIENQVAYIICKCDNLKDIVSKYSCEYYEVINKDFADYIEYNAYYIPTNYPIVIKIIGKFNESEKGVINNVIKDYFGLKLGDKELDIKENNKRQSVILLFGIASLFIFYLLSTLNLVSLILEPFLIVVWVFLWEYVDTLVFKRNKLLKEKTEAIQLASVKIEIKEKNQ